MKKLLAAIAFLILFSGIIVAHTYAGQTPASNVTLIPSPVSPVISGASVTFNALGSGGSGNYEYKFLLKTGAIWSEITTTFGTSTYWVWNTEGVPAGTYAVQVYVRNAGSSASYEALRQIPFTILEELPITTVTLLPDTASPHVRTTPVTFFALGSGGTGTCEYQFQLKTGATWSVVRSYGTGTAWTWDTESVAAGAYSVQVYARNVGSPLSYEASKSLTYSILAKAPATSVTLVPDKASPQIQGPLVIFTAEGAGGTGPYEYRFSLKTGVTWSVVQSYGTATTWTWNTSGDAADIYIKEHYVMVEVRNIGSPLSSEASKSIMYSIFQNAHPTSVTLAPDAPSPHVKGGTVTFSAQGAGGAGPYEYQFWLQTGPTWTVVRSYGTSTTWTWDTNVAEGLYYIMVYVRNVGAYYKNEALKVMAYTIDDTPPANPQVAGPSLTNNTRPTWTWVSGGGGNGTYRYELDLGSWITTTTTFFIPASPLSPGNHTLLVQERDAAGNWSASGIKTIDIDTTGPSLVLSALPDGAVTSDRVLNIVGNATDADGIKSLILISSSTTMTLDPSGFDQALLLALGANTVTVTATDNANNQTTDTRNITLDMTAPVLMVTAPPDNSITNAASIDVAGTVSSPTSTVGVKVNGGSIQEALLSNETYTANISLTSGMNTIEVIATDTTGSSIVNSVKRTVVYTVGGAAILGITSPIEDELLSESSYTLTGIVTAPTGSTIRIDFNGGVYTPPISNGTFTQVLSFVTEKTYTIVATVKDGGGSPLGAVQRNIIYSTMPITLVSDKVSPQAQGALVTYTALVVGGTGTYEYQFLRKFGNGTYVMVQPYSPLNTWSWDTSGAAVGSYSIMVYVRNVGGTLMSESFKAMPYEIFISTPPSATLVSSLPSPLIAGLTVTFTAGVDNGVGLYEYQFQLKTGNGAYVSVQPYSSLNTWVWDTSGAATGFYSVMVYIRNLGSLASYELLRVVPYNLTSIPTATGVTLTPSIASPLVSGNTVTFSAQGLGGSGTYEYKFLLNNGAGWSEVQSYGSSTTWAWSPAVEAVGSYSVMVYVRNAGSAATSEASKQIPYTVVALQPVSSVTLSVNLASPRVKETLLTFTSIGSGGSGSCQYQFYVKGPSTGNIMVMVQDYSLSNTFMWVPSYSGSYTITVYARNAGSLQTYEAKKSMSYLVLEKDPATSVTLTANPSGSVVSGATVTFSAVGSGPSGGPYEYQFSLKTGSTWNVVQTFGAGIWVWNTVGVPAATYSVKVEVRNIGSPLSYEASKTIGYTIR